jgi:hypothetical protein
MLIEKEILSKKYNEIGHVRKTARYFHVSEDEIRKLLNRYGLSLGRGNSKKNRGNNRKHTLNDLFFDDINNSNALYWLGFLMADGCVSKYYIGLDIKDKEHIEKIKLAFESTAPIYTKIIKNNQRNPLWKDSVTYGIHFHSLKLIDAAKRNGLNRKKSLDMVFPEHLINHSLINHFMRGYFDGDGGFSFQKGNQIGFSIRGTKEFLKIYLGILSKNCPLVSMNKKISFESGTHRIQFNGNRVVKQIIGFLYNGAEIETYLDRKFEVAKKYL